MAYKNPEEGRAKHREWSRLHYEANKPSYAQRRDNQRSLYRRVIDEAKTNVPCADCGLVYPPYVMDFDHRPDEIKVDNVAKRASFSSLPMLLAEMAKCDIVCANCHRERTHSRQTGSPSRASIPP